jgi:hypothetical protein
MQVRATRAHTAIAVLAIKTPTSRDSPFRKAHTFLMGACGRVGVQRRAHNVVLVASIDFGFIDVLKEMLAINSQRQILRLSLEPARVNFLNASARCRIRRSRLLIESLGYQSQPSKWFSFGVCLPHPVGPSAWSPSR